LNEAPAQHAHAATTPVLRIPPARGWHVAPWIDVGAYAFGWAWVLVPLLFLGSTVESYLPIFLLVIAATGVHRHFGLPYVYLDGEVRRAHPLRFWLMPALLFVAFVASPWLARQPYTLSVVDIAALALEVLAIRHVLARDVSAARPGALRIAGMLVLPIALALALRLSGVAVVPSVSVSVRALVDAVSLVSGAWNVWHVYMQKYGIFRVYAAKSGATEKVAPAIDRYFVLAWLPLTVVYIGARYGEAANRHFGGDAGIIGPLARALHTAAPVLLPIGVAVVIASIALWVRAEWRASRLKSAPRISLAVGTTLLAASFLVFDPVKVYLAFAFGHALEYMVFVWAFQRRRYGAKLAHDPPIARALRRPLLAYGAFIAIVGAAFLATRYLGSAYLPFGPRLSLFGVEGWEWAYYYGVYQSMAHFYFDGFLWKTRQSSVRANL
jgi:hypothetical protein